MIFAKRQGMSHSPMIFRWVAEISVNGLTCAVDKLVGFGPTCAVDKLSCLGWIWSVTNTGCLAPI